MKTFDPYDLWATSIGVEIKKHYYAGSIPAKLLALMVGVLDWTIPYLSRTMLNIEPIEYPIVLAHEILTRKTENRLSASDAVGLLHTIKLLAICVDNKPGAWGLGFPWMSKNGLYGTQIPFITHTPYVMESLVILTEYPIVQDEAQAIFNNSSDFLETLLVMHQSPDELALSYAPLAEPRIVNNANAYAAYAYSLHAKYGVIERKAQARAKALSLARWVIGQQQADGSWFYYADREPGNLIDCFHSCFVIKNLLKVQAILPDADLKIQESIQRGWHFIRDNFFDKTNGLCKRFILRDIKDPFIWDLYDQAEYLGLLIDFGMLEEASILVEKADHFFHKGENWYCRIDFLGKPWGKNFLRWGITPFWYQIARLNRAILDEGIG